MAVETALTVAVTAAGIRVCNTKQTKKLAKTEQNKQTRTNIDTYTLLKQTEGSQQRRHFFC